VPTAFCRRTKIPPGRHPLDGSPAVILWAIPPPAVILWTIYPGDPEGKAESKENREFLMNFWIPWINRPEDDGRGDLFLSLTTAFH